MKSRGQAGTALMWGAGALILFLGVLIFLDANNASAYKTGEDDYALIYFNGTLVEIEFSNGTIVQAEDGPFQTAQKNYEITEYCEEDLCRKEYVEISVHKARANIEFMVAGLFLFIGFISLYMAHR